MYVIFTHLQSVFSPDKYALITILPGHYVIRIVCNCKNMGRKFTNFLVLVFLHIFCIVDWIKLIWIHCNQNWSSVCLKDSLKLKPHYFKSDIRFELIIKVYLRDMNSYYFHTLFWLIFGQIYINLNWLPTW